MSTHELKCWPQYFESISEGIKTFEIRKDDRGYEVGDLLHLREYDNEDGKYTGNEVWCAVTYIARLNHLPSTIIPVLTEEPYVVMAIKVMMNIKWRKWLKDKLLFR